jgi:DNA invertase Pin-like site-specific DNA recombinase
MRIGYCRVSTDAQQTTAQRAALTAAGVDEIVEDYAVSGYGPRPALAGVLERLEQGDALVVWKLDRLGRRTTETLQTVEELTRRGIEIESLTERLDTRTPGGRAMLGILATMAQYERDLVSERTRAGQQAARAAGKRFGRPPALSPEQVAHAAQLVERGERTIPQAARLMKVGVSTLYRHLRPGA